MVTSVQYTDNAPDRIHITSQYKCDCSVLLLLPRLMYMYACMYICMHVSICDFYKHSPNY